MLSFVHIRKLNQQVNIEKIDNCTQIPTALECEYNVKYLGVLLDRNLSWKFHFNNVALKVSRTAGVVARLRYFVPRTTLLNIYQSLILPYLTYDLVDWGQAAKAHLQKEKFSCCQNESFRRLMYFSEPRAQAVPFFSSNILPLQNVTC